jgi:hypothetical protein
MENDLLALGVRIKELVVLCIHLVQIGEGYLRLELPPTPLDWVEEKFCGRRDFAGGEREFSLR